MGRCSCFGFRPAFDLAMGAFSSFTLLAVPLLPMYHHILQGISRQAIWLIDKERLILNEVMRYVSTMHNDSNNNDDQSRQGTMTRSSKPGTSCLTCKHCVSTREALGMQLASGSRRCHFTFEGSYFVHGSWLLFFRSTAMTCHDMSMTLMLAWSTHH